MPDPVTQAMFFQALTEMRVDVEARHRQVRLDIQHGFAHLSEKLDVHAADDRVVERRVQRMEDRTDFLQEEGRKSAARTSLWISALVVLLVDVVKHLIGWK